MLTKSPISIFLLSVLFCTMISCKEESNDKTADKSSKNSSENVFLKEWTGPYGGVPAFDKMDIHQFEDAFAVAMEKNLKEIEQITKNTETPNFKNTIAAMQLTGQDLDRVGTYYGLFSANLSTEAFRKIRTKMSPILSAHRSKINQNKELFKRIKTVYQESQKTPLEPEEQRLLKMTYEKFTMSGAELDEEKKKRTAAINKDLSSLYTQFSNNVLHDEENYVTYLNKDQLDGLPESFVNSAANIAKEKGKENSFAVTNTRSSMDPFLTYSTERALREKVWNNYYSRGDNGDKYDNNNLIVKILQLRNERVQLLGFENFASWRLQNRMAKTPENALKLLDAVWPSAIARVKEEVADMQDLANKEGAKIKIAPWDYRFYAEKVRKAKYDLNSNEVKEYLQLDKLREAMFFVAGSLFNFKFIPVPEGKVSVFHKDVKVWEVVDKTTNKHIGLWYLDPFARKGKRSGAWALSYRSHSTFDGKKTVLCSNNSNFIKGEDGAPVLISWADATTFFHEMGHALHFLSSNVKYPASNNGVRDYTEFQSQLLERWLSTEEVINNFLTHYKTGKPMPKKLVAKIKKAATFNQGFATTEYMASAIMDMKYHMMDPTNLDVDKYERETLEAMNMPKELVMRHRSPHFGHVFSGEGYATGYYGYMWADVLTSDAAEAFAEAPDGFYDKDIAAKMVKYLFAPRNAIEPAEAYRKFRGRDARIEALMKDKGFPIK